MKVNNIKSKFLFFCLFAITVWELQSIVLRLNLLYGFRDGDWWIIRRYITLGPLSLNHLINGFKLHAVYIYQIYYAGFLTQIFGLDFPRLYQAGHIFKFLATLSVFPCIYLITKNKLTASLTTIIYAVAYPAVGALYMFLTGAYFIAIIFLNFFLISYWTILNQKLLNIRWLLLTFLLFLTTLLLNAERMYPLIPMILITEFFLVIKNNFTKLAIKNSCIRLLVLLSPLVVFYTLYSIFLKSQVNSAFFTPQFFKAIELRWESISLGNWQLLLYPFASFGSMFLYGDFWKFLGNFETSSFTNFLSYFIFRPLFIFFVPTFFLMFLVSKKPLRYTLTTLLPVFGFGVTIYIMAKNWLTVDPSIRIHLDTNFVGLPALFGFYILSLSFSFFLVWLRDRKKDLILPIFIGSGVSFLFVLFTWIGSDIQLLFAGPQRYLTAPSIGSSLVIASLIVLIFSRFKEIKIIKHLAWIILLIIIPVILINAQVTNDFFSYELIYAGMNGTDQTLIKNKFWSLIPNMNNSESSLFYFDETADKQNGYFDESIIMAGFEDWTQFDHGRLLVVNRPDPGMLRTNVQCPEHTHENCMKILKEGFATVNGEKGIWYKDTIRGQTTPRFYKLNNFYALRFINKDLVNIREEVLGGLKVAD